MDERKIDFAMEFSGKEINADLPEIIIKADTGFAALPEAGPAGQIVIEEMNAGHGVGSQGLLDGRPIIYARNNPALFESTDLAGPVPSTAGFRALTGLAGIRGDENASGALQRLFVGCFHVKTLRLLPALTVTPGSGGFLSRDNQSQIDGPLLRQLELWNPADTAGKESGFVL